MLCSECRCCVLSVGVLSDVPLLLHMHAAMLEIGFVDDALKNTVPSVHEPLLQLVDAVIRLMLGGMPLVDGVAGT